MEMEKFEYCILTPNQNAIGTLLKAKVKDFWISNIERAYCLCRLLRIFLKF